MKKVVIIGGGPAGLSAAYSLLKEKLEYEVIILEKSSMVGGISKTITYNGNKMDLGGHRFFTKNKKIQKIWEELLPLQNKEAYDEKLLNMKIYHNQKGNDPEIDNKVFLKRKRVSRIFYNKKFFDYPVTLSFKTIKNLGLKDTIICGFSYLKSCFKKLDETNLENFYINRFGKKLYSIFFKEYTEKLWGIEPSKIDSSWGSQRVKGISIKEVLKDYFKRLFKIKDLNKETSLIDSFYYPKFGPGMMYEEMANKIISLGGVIKLNSEVIKIQQKDGKIISITYKENGKITKIYLDYLISSMPIKDLIEDLNSVPKIIKNISKNLPYRDFLTIGIIFDKLKVFNDSKIKTYNNRVPDTWIYVQSRDVKMGRIQVFNNWSPYLVKDYLNTISLGLEYFCKENDDFWNMKDEDLKEYAKNELIKMGIIDDECNILDYHVERIEKAYPAYFGSYKDFPKIKKYLNQIENLYCIGRNGMHRYNNMDHSMYTGIVCANNIINNITDKENIWSINTDSAYHEVDNENN